MPKKIEITFQPEGKRVRAESTISCLEAAKTAGVDLTSICGGKGKCAKCKVILEKGKENTNSLTEVEKGCLSPAELSAGYRLACRVLVEGPVIFRIPEESRTGRQRLQIEGIQTPVEAEPLTKKYFVRLPKPTLQDPKADVDRLVDGLRTQHGLELEDFTVRYNLLQNLASVLRKAEWEVTATIWKGKEIITVEQGDTTDRNFGYAVDIGSTKVAGYLLDLNSGKVVAVGALMNPQIPYGEDIVSRITYAIEGFDKQDELQRVIAEGINKILTDLCEKVCVNPDNVYDMAVVGNTAMHHIFLNICAKNVALSPYTAVIRRGIDVNPENVRVKINPNGNVYVAPVIAGYVGADTVGVVLATEIYKRKELCLAVDVGTNTEVVLGNKDEMLACSCASGPAFEGERIKHGMRASTGAIEKVKINPETFEVQYWTIDNAKPCGICGSAIVDVPAEMLKAGIIDVQGIMNKTLDSPRLRLEKGETAFIIAKKEETQTGEDIVVTQKDIREIQLAKAAMHTGAEMLMKKSGITEKDIDILFIAGAFGSYIDPESARIIGMYPEVPLEKVKVVGNAAGTGARMALISKTARETAEEISRKVKYMELAADPSFQKEFLNSNSIPHADLSRYPATSELLKRLGKYPAKPPIIFK